MLLGGFVEAVSGLLCLFVVLDGEGVGEESEAEEIEELSAPAEAGGPVDEKGAFVVRVE